MTDYAIKNYHSGKTSLSNKLKALAAIVLCFAVFGGLTAVASEVGHAMQMERIAAGD